MASAREVKLRIKSVKNIAQVTRALQAVSASRVRKAMDNVLASRPFANMAWRVMQHVSDQPGRDQLHPLLIDRPEVRSTLVVVISSDRGLAGPYNTNILKYALDKFDEYQCPVRYVTIGAKAVELLARLDKEIYADFSDLPAEPGFGDISPIGRLLVDEFMALDTETDEVYLVYTDFINMIRQEPTHKRLLPISVDKEEDLVRPDLVTQTGPRQTYYFEPNQSEILEEIVPRFTALQVYQAVLEANASEHAARMVAMKNATDNASDLADVLQLQYNNVRQQTITNEMLDIAGGAEALAKSGK